MPDGHAGRPVRVLIVNTVALNVGDAAILMGEIRALRDAYDGKVSVTVADDEPAVAARLYPDIDIVPGLHPRHVRGTKWGRSLRRRRITLAIALMRWSVSLGYALLDSAGRAHVDIVRRADVVISTGGTYLVEHYRVRGRAEQILLAQALGKPTYLYTQSLGPFNAPANRLLMRRTLRNVHHVFVRDQRSRGHVTELGIPDERVSVVADAAFALARDHQQPEADVAEARSDRSEAPGAAARQDVANTGTRAARNDPLRVAISVREWKRFAKRTAALGDAAYRHAIAELVQWLRAEYTADVTFVSTCQGVAEYWADDSRYARALVDELLSDTDAVRVDSVFRRPPDLIAYLRTFDVVVATRMHFAILSLIAGVPVLPIAYEFKTAELFSGLGMSELVVDIESITSHTLRDKARFLLDRRDALTASMRALLPGLVASALEPAAFIRGRHPARSPALTATSAPVDPPDRETA